MSTTGVIGLVSSTSTPVISAEATALAANPGRVGWIIQNLGTNPLFVRFGAGASSSVFNVVLAAGTVNDNGTGGLFAQTEGVVHDGVVTIAGVAPRYVATEIFE
jgi:hypothetical protein